MNYMTRTLLAGIAAIALTAPAAALTYLFNFDGPVTASWSLPASPTPDGSDGFSFQFAAVDMIVEGNPVTAAHFYYNEAGGGGLFVSPPVSLNLFGPQLYSGTTDSPTFLLGGFTMEDDFGSPIGTLIISEAVIPEPATWGMLIAGFGLVGTALRRRKSVAA